MTDSDAPPPLTAEQRALLRSAAWPAILALIAIGAATGLLVGLSQSPVVAVVLPLLFGLVAGGSGLWISRLDAQSETQIRLFRVAMAGTAAFAVAFVIALIVGIDRRLPDRFADLGIEGGGAPIDLAEMNLSFETVAAAIAARQQFAALGASPAEQKAILTHYLASAATEAANERPDPGRFCARVEAALTDAAQALGAPAETIAVEQAVIDELLALGAAAGQLAIAAKSCVSLAEAGETRAATRLANHIRDENFMLLQSSAMYSAFDNLNASPWAAMSAFPGLADAFSRVIAHGADEPFTLAADAFPKLPADRLFAGAAERSSGALNDTGGLSVPIIVPSPISSER